MYSKYLICRNCTDNKVFISFLPCIISNINQVESILGLY